jgi:hypothetical protein
VGSIPTLAALAMLDGNGRRDCESRVFSSNLKASTNIGLAQW